jgi:hypothetical protein
MVQMRWPLGGLAVDMGSHSLTGAVVVRLEEVVIAAEEL